MDAVSVWQADSQCTPMVAATPWQFRTSTVARQRGTLCWRVLTTLCLWQTGNGFGMCVRNGQPQYYGSGCPHYVSISLPMASNWQGGWCRSYKVCYCSSESYTLALTKSAAKAADAIHSGNTTWGAIRRAFGSFAPAFSIPARASCNLTEAAHCKSSKHVSLVEDYLA